MPSALGSCYRLSNGNHFLGENLAVGDFNGDLCSDLVFGDRGFSASTGGSGVLYLLNQPRRSGTGSSATCDGMNTYSTVTSGVADHVIDLSTFSSGGTISGQRVARLRGTLYEGETYNERAGAYVIAPGDLDGDGIDDVVTTAYDYTRSSSYNFEGKTHVIYGSSGTPRARVLPLSENVSASRGSSFTGGGAEYKFGKHPGIAGDFDGDGAPDFMSGSARNRTYLIFGSPSGKSFHSGDIDSESNVLTILDSSISNSTSKTSQGVKIGDLDGDGDDEILILVQSRGGPDNYNAYIVSGGCH